MKKSALFTALALLSAWATFGQHLRDYDNYKPWHRNRTSIRFEQPEEWVNIRDIVYLEHFNEIRVELNKVQDYDYLKNIDDLIARFKKDIAFYQDSLKKTPPGNVRIDYSITHDSFSFVSRAQIRFKYYYPDGDAYTKTEATVARLKMEQDTINFILHLPPDAHQASLKRSPASYVVQVSFFLNNYAQIFDLVNPPGTLSHIFDTLRATQKKATVSDPYKFPSTTVFKTTTADEKYRLQQYRGIVKRNEIGYPHLAHNRADKLMLNFNMGVGLVRNTLAPTADIGISFYNLTRAYHTRNFQDEEINTYIGASVSPYFFFDKGTDGHYYIKDNWFVNLEVGGAARLMDTPTPLLTGGIGYLFAPKGYYFKGTTMKAFMNIRLRNGFTVSPELIVTDNFKQVFPGLTLKIF